MPRRHTSSGSIEEDCPKLYLDQITLKQFRDAECPGNACYQALVSSPMGYERFNRGGLLGDVNLLRGDPSGGFAIRIHRYAAQPIVERLGILVSRVEEGDDCPVDMLKPTFPFWTDVDLYYGEGKVVCSRVPRPVKDSSEAWVDEQDSEAPTIPADEFKGPQCRIPYNTARDGATQALAGPFHFPDLTLQVYPLIAEPATLGRFLDRYLNVPLKSLGHVFEAFGSYVYLMVTVYGDQVGTMWSEANDIGWWADREVSFCVPVKWYRDKELISLALVSPFVFANSGRAVTTDREVNGRPAVKASIESPQDPWLMDRGPAQGRRLLKLETEVYPALHMGQQAESRTLLEIDGNDVLPDNDDAAWRFVAENWGEELLRDLKRKAYYQKDHQKEVRSAKALALEILAHGAPVNWIHVKQYRDVVDTDSTCYQAVVHTRRSITCLLDMREIEDRVHVRLHRYPGQPIAETLGLKAKQVDSRGGSVVQSMQPIRPFWMHMSVNEELGELLCWRTDDTDWSATHPWCKSGAPQKPADDAPHEAPYFEGAKPRWFTRVGAELGEPRRFRDHIKDQADDWLRQSLYKELGAMLKHFSAEDRTKWEPWLKRQWSRRKEYGSVRAFADCLTTDELRKLVDALFFCLVEDGKTDAAVSKQRLSCEEARKAIDKLEDIQIPIENILSDELEHWGGGRRSRQKRDGERRREREGKTWDKKTVPEPQKPPLCVRSDSLGQGGTAHLERRHKDVKFFEDDWWYVDTDGV